MVTGGQLLTSAQRYLGVPYAWGGESVSGIDCSGLVQLAAQGLGLTVPRTSEEQSAAATPISAAAAQPGDLVFYGGPPGQASHVGIYAGGGQMLDAAHTGSNVQIESLWPGAYFGRLPGVSSSGGGTVSSVIAAIAAVASRLGIPVPVALADAQVESGLNPNAVGDQGTSYGLYELHQGGELGNHTQAWADDPTNNATTALTQLAAVHAAQPGLDWGSAAAAAQRPADPTGYAATVNKALAALGGPAANPSTAETLAASTPSSSSAFGAVPVDFFPGGAWDPLNGPQELLGAAGSAVGGLASSALSGLSTELYKGLTSVVLVGAGAALVVLGVVKAASGSGGGGGGGPAASFGGAGASRSAEGTAGSIPEAAAAL